VNNPVVIPAQAGIKSMHPLNSRLRGNDFNKPVGRVLLAPTSIE
jgi:hypothetical protein